MIEVIELTEATSQAWDSYVHVAGGGMPLHLSGWRSILERTSGYETRFLMACSPERVVGVLPLFFVRSLLVGNTAMTMPGGMCADSDEVAGALLARALQLSRLARMKRLVVQDSRRAWDWDCQTVSDHVHWTVDLSDGAENLWNGLHRNIRRQVRMAIKNGLAAEVDRTGAQLGAFYEVFSRFTHQVGTPVFGRDFLEHVLELLPDNFNIAVVRYQNQPIGGYFQLEMGQRVYGMWGATLPEYLELRPVYLAYWELLRDSAEHGYRFLDMGRSPRDSNASKFKGQWGGVDAPIYQQTTSLIDRVKADSVVKRAQTDNRMQLVQRIWPRLPLPVANALGPRLRRHVPFA